jgi:hypothetical protein
MVRLWEQVLALGPRMLEGLAWPGQQPRVRVLQQEQRPQGLGQLVPQGLVLVQQVRVLLHCLLAVVRSVQ